MHLISGPSSTSSLLLLDVHVICPSAISVSILRFHFRYEPSRLARSLSGVLSVGKNSNGAVRGT